MYQYLVKVQYKYQVKNGEWSRIASVDQFKTIAEARKALKDLIAKRNGGKRTETTHIANGIGISMEYDDDLRVEHWKIQKRKVTPWEMVDEA